MHAETPQITTVIPTYRRPHLVRRAIRSALAQTYRDMQVCVYDNASGDETAAVVAELARNDPRVKYYCHAENIGMSGNIAYGLQRVNTPYFSLLSDDDYLLPDFYATTMAGFAQHPDAMLSAGSTVQMTEAGEITHVPLAQWKRVGYFAPPEGLFEWTIEKHPNISGILFRREVLDRVGLFDPNVFHSDYEYEWRVVSRFPYFVSRTPSLAFIIHGQQATRANDADVWYASYQTIHERLMGNTDLAPAVRDRAAAMLRATFANAMLVMGLAAIRDRRFGYAENAGWSLIERFDRRRNGRLLVVLARTCARVRPISWLVNAVYTLLVRSRTREHQQLQQLVMAARPE
jgi:GT2 family glycosyltransferase